MLAAKGKGVRWEDANRSILHQTVPPVPPELPRYLAVTSP